MSRARVVIGLEPEDFCFELGGGARGYGVGARGYGVGARGYGSHEILLSSPGTGVFPIPISQVPGPRSHRSHRSQVPGPSPSRLTIYTYERKSFLILEEVKPYIYKAVI